MNVDNGFNVGKSVMKQKSKDVHTWINGNDEKLVTMSLEHYNNIKEQLVDLTIEEMLEEVFKVIDECFNKAYPIERWHIVKHELKQKLRERWK